MELADAAKVLLGDIYRFSRLVIGVPLRPYQAEPLRAILESILARQGREFLMVFPRQSGKNEAVAQLTVYLLNLLQRVGGNIVFAAVGDGVGRGIQRLEERLDNPLNEGKWSKGSRPQRRALGKASAIFISSHPQAATRGESAHWLLIIDELQDQDLSHIEAVFEPMRAANNATALFIGTVKMTNDALWQKRIELRRLEQEDGQQRLFIVTPEQVARDNPPYGLFLERKVKQLGRQHPIVASEYFNEPIDGSGGLFDRRRQALMRGTHPRLDGPLPNEIYLATLDVAGQDEAATDPLARLKNPARDYTVATIFALRDGGQGGPRYEAVDLFVDHGSRHFEDVAGRPMLARRLLAWFRHWKISHVMVDQGGVGEGLFSWLQAHMGAGSVTGVPLGAGGRKAGIGSTLVALIETGRFKYWSGDGDRPLSDGWWFWQQVEACRYEVPLNGRFERDLRWEVPAGARVSTPEGLLPIHDDRLMSAALVAEYDALLASGKLRSGAARSTIIDAEDPLDDLEF